MNRKTLTRIAFAAVAAPALALGGPAVAMADSFYGSGGQHAGPTGATQWGTGSAVVSPDFHHKGDKVEQGHGHHHGGSVYVDGYEYAGPWGAGQGGTISGTR
ncbi:hypothetical protein IDM40_17690 [Nocardiopsis sp. HNM0947]|uniref:Uncharacterized protein n=1 Tax=Nocardiopsis coralli TaxID=2772213 RepID=A0ABR9P9K2_9ACTN|nr:hypothetical protein [Nocardiopsis coralli]MBE3000521.1 hypothetical protein [Nocardiopsis coralli]